MLYVNKSKNCWEWNGVKSWKGYGRFGICYNGVQTLPHAHRISFFIFNGDIPKGMTVHHKCENKSCVNPEHLKLLTEKENRELSGCWSAKNKRKTHCVNGHEFTEENTYLYKTKNNERLHRLCKKCRLENFRNWYAKKK